MLAVSQFRAGDFKNAIDAFIDLDINPAKVVALYPENVSGRLHVATEKWIPLFGGPEPKQDPPSEAPGEVKANQPSSVGRTPSPAGSVRAKRRGTLDTLSANAGTVSDKEEDRVSLRGRMKKNTGEFFRRLKGAIH